MNLATLWNWLLPILTWAMALAWLWQWMQWIRNSPQVPDLKGLKETTESQLLIEERGLAELSVVVPACNEAASIGVTLRALLASTGIRLQILAVDDRSTDGTGQIMQSVMDSVKDCVNMAIQEDAELLKNTLQNPLQIIPIKELPEGWLGKPHAMAMAARAATSEWLLFTDGDVVFAPGALSLAMQYAKAEQADHVVVMPDWTMKSHGEAAMHGALHALSTWTVKLWRVADPKARDFLGVGAFNLIRRRTYDAIGGFEGLRMEVLEDLRLGWKVKRAGYRQRVVLGPGLVAVRWAAGAWGVVRNLEKNLFALYRYRVLVTLGACLGLAVQIFLPIVSLVFGGWPARFGALAVYAAVTGIYFASRKVTRVSPAYAALYPFAASLFLFAMLRSMTLALLRGGVVWRGTLYSLKDLRAQAGPFW